MGDDKRNVRLEREFGPQDLRPENGRIYNVVTYYLFYPNYPVDINNIDQNYFHQFFLTLESKMDFHYELDVYKDILSINQKIKLKEYGIRKCKYPINVWYEGKRKYHRFFILIAQDKINKNLLVQFEDFNKNKYEYDKDLDLIKKGIITLLNQIMAEAKFRISFPRLAGPKGEKGQFFAYVESELAKLDGVNPLFAVRDVIGDPRDSG